MSFRLRSTATVLAASAAALLTVLAGAGSGSAAVTPSSWFQSGFNQSRTGSNPQESQLTSANVAGLHKNWSVTTPPPCCDASQTTGVVTTGGITYFVGAAADVHAVKTTTGTPVWSQQAPECAGADAGPALHLGVLLVPTHACTPDDFNSWLTAYDAATGHLLWSLKAVNSMSSPAAFGGVAFVESENAANLGRHKLQAVDVQTGAVLWQRALGANDPALAGDGSNLFLSSQTTLQALDPATGAVRWSRSVRGGHVLLSAGHVVVGGASGGAQRIAAYTTGGTKQWSVSTPGATSYFMSATTSEVVIADTGGFVQAITLAAGQGTWFSSFSTAVTSQPAIAGGVVYVTVATPRSGAVYALRDGVGSILWHFTEPAFADSEDTAAPSVAAGQLFVSLGSGVVRAFQP
jgi:outer membrane protein assembly factor BamB